jgi:hypothetical protein
MFSEIFFCSQTFFKLFHYFMFGIMNKKMSSFVDPDPGSRAFLTPVSRMRNMFFPDPGSRIPDSGSIFLRA